MRFAALAVLVLVSSCAYVGDPKPPTLDIPSPVTDLSATEVGNQIAVNFTLPPLTMEGLALTGVQAIELRVNSAALTRNLKIPMQEPGPVKFSFLVQDWAGKSVALSVRATGPKSKTSEWSNVFTFPVTTPLVTPSSLMAVATAEGVRLNWQGNGMRYQIFRSMPSAPAAPPVKIGESDMPVYVDTSAEFGMEYRYTAQAVNSERNQSEMSVAITIAPKDIFPPGVPQGLSGVAGVDAIELSWERNAEPDFAGYNIFRSLNAGVFAKIAEKVPTPTFSDRMIMPGVKYAYVISAVDDTGNESGRSLAVEVTAP